MPVFPIEAHLELTVLFLAIQGKDIDRMQKRLLDVLEGLIYESDVPSGTTL